MSEAINQKTKRIFESAALVMWAPSPGTDNKFAKLSWGISGVNPRITVFTNNPADTGPGIVNSVISAPMNLVTMLTFLSHLENCVKSSTEIKGRIACYTMKWENGLRTNEKILLSEVWFGRDAEGLIWISLISPNRPQIRFVFSISDYCVITKSDGTTTTNAENSQISALATITALRSSYSAIAGDGFANAPGQPAKTDLINEPKNDWDTSPSGSVNQKAFDDIF